MAWFYLLLAGCFEICFTTCLKLSDDFTDTKYTAGFLACTVFSFYFLSKSLNTIPIGTSYAVWTGIGAAGTAIVGMLFFNDSANIWRLLFLALIILSTFGLKLVSEH